MSLTTGHALAWQQQDALLCPVCGSSLYGLGQLCSSSSVCGCSPFWLPCDALFDSCLGRRVGEVVCKLHVCPPLYVWCVLLTCCLI